MYLQFMKVTEIGSKWYKIKIYDIKKFDSLYIEVTLYRV